jgi:DNA repair protein RadA/Sms
VTRVAKTVSRERSAFRCTECGWQTSKWIGRCGECQAWGTVAELGAVAVRTVRPGPVTEAARPIGQVSVEAAQTRSSGVAELDRVLGGGLVPGAVLLLAGEPGVGKSTLLLEVAARFAGTDAPALYVTGEESAAQVRLRADRIGALAGDLYLAAETDLGAVLGQLDSVKPDLLVLDSVQAVTSTEVEGGAGGVTQVREVAGALIKTAKERGIATVLVGHVTKDGSIAGPRVLEHLVDVVLYFEGDRHARLRMLRAVKNRFGPSDEVGCFDLGDAGIEELPDPSGLFLTRRHDPVPGTCVTVALEGRRPLVAEVQALVAPTSLATPRRASSGLDSSRLSMVLAVLERRCGLDLSKRDVYSATVGGVRVAEPAADLAVGLAIASATLDRPLPTGVVAIGEIGLAGEIRRVSGLSRRLAEAVRLGFQHALVPPDPGTIPAGLRVSVVTDMGDLLTTLAQSAGSTAGRSRA